MGCKLFKGVKAAKEQGGHTRARPKLRYHKDPLFFGTFLCSGSGSLARDQSYGTIRVPFLETFLCSGSRGQSCERVTPVFPAAIGFLSLCCYRRFLCMDSQWDGLQHAATDKPPNAFLSESYRVTRASMIWYGMVWYGMVWYDMIWYGMVWYGMVW